MPRETATSLAGITGAPATSNFLNALLAPAKLAGLVKATYVLRITVRTADGQTIKGSRTYHTCHARLKGGRHKL